MTRPQLSYCRTLLLYALLASALLYPGTEAVVKGGSGASSSGGARTSTGTTAAAASRSGTTTYGRSIGVSNRFRVVAAATLAIVYFGGLSYPAARFYYPGYYDDCALRNITAQKAGLNDSSVDEVMIAQLPNLIAQSNSSADIYDFNQTLYNSTNGLIVDPAYCNYTSTSSEGGGAAGAAQLSLLLTVFLAVTALCVTAVSGGGGGSVEMSWVQRP